MTLFFQHRTGLLTFGKKPLKMGIINVTPDSFSDGGKMDCIEKILTQAHLFLDAGFDVIDLGAESTRPNANPITVQTEIERLKNPLEALRQTFKKAVISVDTRHAETVEYALKQGADIINDVSGGNAFILKQVARVQAGYILMHSRAEPRVMQNEAFLQYDHLNQNIINFLSERMQQGVLLGLKPEMFLLDPGLGFSKTVAQNIEIINALPTYVEALNRPLLIGHSRKRFVRETYPLLTPDAATALFSQQMQEMNLPLMFRLHQFVF